MTPRGVGTTWTWDVRGTARNVADTYYDSWVLFNNRSSSDPDWATYGVLQDIEVPVTQTVTLTVPPPPMMPPPGGSGGSGGSG